LTTFLLIRHAAHDYLGRAIAGRQPGIHLNEMGRRQAQQLATRLSSLPIDAIYSSPLDRAQETAEPVARRFDLPVRIAHEFTEFDFGDWTNRTFTELQNDSHWRAFNSFRSCTAAPSGELMSEVEARMVRKIFELGDQHRYLAIFGHGDPIRAALAHFLGIHLDLFQRIEVDAASINVVELGQDWLRVRLLNATCEGEPLQLAAIRDQ
jgi:broad specificity phosphatase PhoE